MDKNSVISVAIGSFDGIHRGHKKLIDRLGQNGALVVIDTPNACLTPGNRREEYAMVDCFYYDLEAVKSLRGEEFLALLKSDFVGLKRIVVGYDFRFGANRAWDKYDLKRLFDGEVIVVDEFSFDGLGVHSSAIRRFLKDGDIYRANRLLGREYSAAADVISGQGIGKKELFATLNLDFGPYLVPASGVYATRTKIAANTFGSVSFIGHRLSTDGAFSIETHILDMELNSAPKSVQTCFIERIRDNRKFDNLSELKEQIAKDIALAKSCAKSCDLSLKDDSSHIRELI